MKLNATIFGPLVVALIVGTGGAWVGIQTGVALSIEKIEALEKRVDSIIEKIDRHLGKEGAHLDVKTKLDTELSWRKDHSEQHVRIFARLRDIEAK
jgi:hypothetical protein